MYTAKLSLTVPNQKPPMCPSIVEWTNKLYLFNGLLYKNENEWMNATFCSKDKSQEHNVEWKKKWRIHSTCFIYFKFKTKQIEIMYYVAIQTNVINLSREAREW